MNQTQDAANQTVSQETVSLGPACLVVFIVVALMVSVGFVFLAWKMMGQEPIQASSAIDKQLIPWVEQSTLDPIDKGSILERLHELSASIQKGELNSRQLSRLRIRLVDSPVLQWGTVQQVQQKISQSGLTQPEKEASLITCDRLLKAASDNWLAINQLEFVLQDVANRERLSGRLILKSDVSDMGLREFLRRASSLADNAKIPIERLDRSVSQVFRMMIDEALTIPTDR